MKGKHNVTTQVLAIPSHSAADPNSVTAGLREAPAAIGIHMENWTAVVKAKSLSAKKTEQN